MINEMIPSIDKRQSDIFAVLKAIAIIAVVAGHTMFVPVGRFVYLFHLPLFFFCTGFFFKDKYVEDKIGFVKNRFMRLYVPAVCFGLVFLALYNVLFDLNVYSEHFGYLDSVSHRYVFEDYVLALKGLALCEIYRCGSMMGAMWFVRSILICSIAFCFLAYFSKKISKTHSEVALAVMIFALAIAFNWVPYEWYRMPLKENIVREFVCGVPLMYFGRLFRYVNVEKYRKFILPSGVVSFVILVMICIVGYDNSVGNGWHQTSLLMHYSVSLMGVLFAYVCANYLVKTSLFNSLKLIGLYTFEIMALHFIAFKVVSLLQIYIYNYDISYLSKFPVIETNSHIWFIPYTIVGVGLPLVYVWAKNKILNVGKLKTNLAK